MGKIQPPLARVVRSCMVPFFGELLYLKPFIDEAVAYKGFVKFGFWGSFCARVIITDARLNLDYSGGPVIDVHGKMIGLNTAYVWNCGIAVSINTVKRIVESIEFRKKIVAQLKT